MPSRTTESFTRQSVWLYHRSVQASTRVWTSMRSSGSKRTFRWVAYGNAAGDSDIRSSEEELARQPGLALVPLAVPMLEDTQIQVLVVALLDGHVESAEFLGRQRHA